MTQKHDDSSGSMLIDYALMWLPDVTADRNRATFEAAQKAFQAATDTAMDRLRFEDEPQHFLSALSTDGDKNERSS